MTTDTAEQPQADTLQAQTDGGDSELQAATDLLAEVTGEKQESKSPEGTASDAEGTDSKSPETQDDPDPLEQSLTARAEAIAEQKLAEREAEAKAKAKADADKARETARKEGIKRSFDQNAPLIRNVLEQVTRGEIGLHDYMPGTSTTFLDGILNTFSQHGSIALEASSMKATEAIIETVGSWLPDDARDALLKDHANTTDVSAFLNDAKEALVKDARKGYYTEAQHKQAVADGMWQYRKWITDKAHPERLASLAPGPRTRGNGNSATVLSYSTKREARALHVQRQITSAEMRRVERDPSIPES